MSISKVIPKFIRSPKLISSRDRFDNIVKDADGNIRKVTHGYRRQLNPEYKKKQFRAKLYLKLLTSIDKSFPEGSEGREHVSHINQLIRELRSNETEGVSYVGVMDRDVAKLNAYNNSLMEIGVGGLEKSTELMELEEKLFAEWEKARGIMPRNK